MLPVEIRHVPVVDAENVKVATLALVATTEIIDVDAPVEPRRFPLAS
jgi:hypothetical protein